MVRLNPEEKNPRGWSYFAEQGHPSATIVTSRPNRTVRGMKSPSSGEEDGHVQPAMGINHRPGSGCGSETADARERWRRDFHHHGFGNRGILARNVSGPFPRLVSGRASGRIHHVGSGRDRIAAHFQADSEEGGLSRFADETKAWAGGEYRAANPTICRCSTSDVLLSS